MPDIARERVADARETGARSLDLSGLELTELPPGVTELLALESLLLNNNRLTGLPASIANLSSLERLNLDGNRLMSVPSEIGALAQLTRLELGGNMLDRLPGQISELQSLRSIFLTANQFTEIPDSVMALPNLRSLHITRNIVASLPETLGSLDQLRRLDVDGNRLSQLPSSIGALHNLQRIDLHGNALRDLPSSFGDLSALEVLQLTSNDFEAIPEAVFNLRSLRVLAMGENRLIALPPGVGSLTGLQRLDLANNQLQSLPAELTHLDRLETVACRPTGSRSAGLLIQGNKLKPSLLDAADLGLDSLYRYLRNPPADTEEGDSLGSDNAGAAITDLLELTGTLEFRRLVDHPDSSSLRKAIEPLIELATRMIEAGSFETDPVRESQVTADRNLLQEELTRSPTLDATIVVPHVFRLTQELLSGIPDERPGKQELSKLIDLENRDPRQPDEMLDSARELSEAMERAQPMGPDSTSSWSQWIAERMGWLGRVDEKEVARTGAAVLAGAEIASILGATGPIAVGLGAITAILSIVFRRREGTD